MTNVQALMTKECTNIQFPISIGACGTFAPATEWSRREKEVTGAETVPPLWFHSRKGIRLVSMLPMNKMITVVTRFQLPAGVTADQIRVAFEDAAPRFRNVPGLVRKQFLRSKDCRTAGGVYLWNDEGAARAFMNDRVAPMIREKFHVDPTIEFYDSPVIVEN